MQLKEGNGTVNCYSTGTGTGGTVGTNSANCSINKLVGTLDQVPGGTPLTASITMTNVGTINASLESLVMGSCSAAAASDANGYVGSDTSGFCGKVDFSIGISGKCIYPANASAACPATPTSSGTLAVRRRDDLQHVIDPTAHSAQRWGFADLHVHGHARRVGDQPRSGPSREHDHDLEPVVGGVRRRRVGTIGALRLVPQWPARPLTVAGRGHVARCLGGTRGGRMGGFQLPECQHQEPFLGWDPADRVDHFGDGELLFHRDRNWRHRGDQHRPVSGDADARG